MISAGHGYSDDGVNLRQAALTAGFAYLLMPVTLAELLIFPRLLIPGDVEQTAQNIVAHPRLFVVGILCHLATLVLDVVIAWALYILLAPVSRSLSLLSAWFRLVYTVVGLSGLVNLLTVFRLLTVPYFLTIFGSQQLHAQVQLGLNSFRYTWSVGLVIFGIHLGLVGYLICRSWYIPRILGVLLLALGFGWIIYCLRPYLYPNAPLGFIPIAGFGELLFPLWLIVKGWTIAAPTRAR